MNKKHTINVEGSSITVISVNGHDYVSLTDMVKNFGDDSIIKNWLRNRNTLEFLGVWEQLHNLDFKLVEFDQFKKQAGLNSFVISPKKWIDGTGAIGLVSKAGRYGGGTFAHNDIAFEFGSWLSPKFKLLLIKEFQRLKQAEIEGEQWDYRRFLSKVNYRLHTDSIKENIIPKIHVPKNKEWIVYASEADILNVALFGITAQQWRQENPQLVLRNENMRDYATIEELTVLANLENLNATLIADNMDKKERFIKLEGIAEKQLQTLMSINVTYRTIESSGKRPLSINTPFNETIKKIVRVKPPKENDL